MKRILTVLAAVAFMFAMAVPATYAASANHEVKVAAATQVKTTKTEKSNKTMHKNLKHAKHSQKSPKTSKKEAK